MAETNGSGILDNHEDRLNKLEAARREMEDMLIVMSHLETKASARIKEHAQFMADLELSMQSHEKRMEDQARKTEALDQRVDKLVSSIGELIARIPPTALTK